jgi:uncharacterized protein YbbC (DUF1343 family)
MSGICSMIMADIFHQLTTSILLLIKMVFLPILNGVSEEEIRKSWEPGLSAYKEMRKKYLLYP